MDYVGRADFARTMVRPSLPILSCDVAPVVSSREKREVS